MRCELLLLREKVHDLGGIFFNTNIVNVRIRLDMLENYRERFGYYELEGVRIK